MTPSPAVWQQPDVQQALANLEFGTLCRLIREHMGWRQSDLAALLGINQGFLSQLERGMRRVTDVEKMRTLLRDLGVPPALSPLPACASSESVPRDPRPSPTPATRNPAPDAGDLTASAAAESLAFVQAITPGSVTDDELQYLLMELSRIAVDYVHAPVLPLFNDLLKVRDRAFKLVQGQQRPSQRATLFVLTGATCLLLAHASQNLGDEKSALAQLHAAWSCARQVDHTGLKAWIRGTYALVAEWSPRQQRALTFTAEAAALAPPGESRIRIAAIEARTAARLGDRTRALHALRRMQDAQAETPVEDELSELGGILTFPRAKQEYYAGSVYSLLGEHSRAEEHASDALIRYASGPPAERSYGDEALALIDVITARLALGDFDTAGELLHRILSLPPALRIRQLENGLRRVEAVLHQPALAKNRTAQELTELTRGYAVAGNAAPVPSSR
ncbi:MULTISPECIES: helix-turn-helix transcriptional regulator [Streptomyces]|uniref:helix-turn-helix domain-containing protein n=1 Tax=Streptomyces TaxID=1883 RepID=UPI0031D279A4